MAKGDKFYFYAGTVLAKNREGILLFSGTWLVGKNDSFPDVLSDIILFESTAHGGADVTLTAFNEL